MHDAPNLSRKSLPCYITSLSKWLILKETELCDGLFNSCVYYRGKQGCTFSQPPYNSLVSSLFVFPDRGCVGGLFSEATRYRSPLSLLTSTHSLTPNAWPEGGGVESKNRPHPEWININTWRGSNLHNLFTLPFIVGRGIVTNPPHSISSTQANNNFTYDLFSPQQRDTST